MSEGLVELIVDESQWLSISLAVAFLAVIALAARLRGSRGSRDARVLAAMNLFFGVLVGTMAFGHLLAVTTKLAVGTLTGSVALFYLIGIVLAAPSWLLIRHARRTLDGDEGGRATLVLNAWLVVTLLALGPHNLPLAAPGLLNIGYRLSSARRLRWAIVGLAVAIGVGLFVASLVFLASGQSFEQFQGAR